MKQKRKSIISFIRIVIIEFILFSYIISGTYPLEEIKSLKWLGTAIVCTNIFAAFYLLSKEIKRLKQ